MIVVDAPKLTIDGLLVVTVTDNGPGRGDVSSCTPTVADTGAPAAAISRAPPDEGTTDTPTGTAAATGVRLGTGAVSTWTANSRCKPSAVSSVRVAVPAVPVTIPMAAIRLPAGITMGELVTCVTDGLLLVMVTTVSTVAGAGRKTTPSVTDRPRGANAWPTNGRPATLTPTACVKTTGVWLGCGLPTTMVTVRTLVPALSVSCAVPSIPVVIESVVTCSPGAIEDAVAVTTLGALLVTDTTKLAPLSLGTGSAGTLTVKVRPAGEIT